MRVLVTGSSGRVGSRAVSQLLHQDHQVCGFDLRPSGLSADGYREIIGGLDNANSAAVATDGIDAVLHLGAFMSWAPQDRTRMFSSNVEGTRILLDAASAAGVQRFVFASSGEVYPENAPASLPIAEDHPLTLRPDEAIGRRTCPVSSAHRQNGNCDFEVFTHPARVRVA